MMNTRIIELLQQPKLIAPEDLSLLENQIRQQPYMQNIRALYLYGVHLHQPQRYKEILTTTAAYTTDKKILYQFINQKSNPEIAESASQVISVSQVEIKKNDEKLIKSDSEDVTKTAVDIEKEVESLEVEKEERKEDSHQEVSNDVVDESKTVIIHDSPIQSVQEPIMKLVEELKTNEELKAEVVEEPISIEEDLNISKEVSFDAIDDFLPDVKFSVPKNHNTFLNPPKFEKPKPQEVVVPTIISEESKEKTEDNIVNEEDSDTISFHETADFGSFNQDQSVEEVVILPHDNSHSSDAITEELVIEEIWQPMHVDNHTPDALIGKSSTVSTPEPVIVAVKVSDIKENKTGSEVLNKEPENTLLENSREESRPIINASFFSDALSIVSDKKEDDLIHNQQNTTEKPLETTKSNVGSFINTWQNWLKIDRVEESAVKKELRKDKAIEQFIENQPKISQLKDEVSFVVKEKKEDISHLMTETLANLYLEQRLYTKAIKAFEILITKHPEKNKHFLSRIKEIKDIRKPF